MGGETASPDDGDLTIVVATRVEALAVRRLVPGAPVLVGGIGLRGLDPARLATQVVLSVGVAGGLATELRSGTVVVPAQVGREDGRLLATDVVWSAALERASRRLGYPTVTSPLLSAGGLVTGTAARRAWAARGFAAVDMETALLAAAGCRVAAVRVVLDTPEREISADWMRPARAALDPRRWAEGVWLAGATPRCAARAARVVAAALEEVGISSPASPRPHWSRGRRGEARAGG